jgi:hypothetical protein
MRIRLATLLVLVGISAALAQSPAWPPLPASGFTKGRPATDEDVAAGNAVFVLKQYGVYFGKPLDVDVPQYAYLTKGGGKVPVIVVQAEQERNLKLFGVRGLDGQKWVAKETELQLLGTHPPQ